MAVPGTWCYFFLKSNLFRSSEEIFLCKSTKIDFIIDLVFFMTDTFKFMQCSTHMSWQILSKGILESIFYWIFVCMPKLTSIYFSVHTSILSIMSELLSHSFHSLLINLLMNLNSSCRSNARMINEYVHVIVSYLYIFLMPALLLYQVRC